MAQRRIKKVKAALIQELFVAGEIKQGTKSGVRRGCVCGDGLAIEESSHNLFATSPPLILPRGISPLSFKIRQTPFNIAKDNKSLATTPLSVYFFP